MNYCGRRATLSGCLFLSGASCIAAGLVTHGKVPSLTQVARDTGQIPGVTGSIPDQFLWLPGRYRTNSCGYRVDTGWIPGVPGRYRAISCDYRVDTRPIPVVTGSIPDQFLWLPGRYRINIGLNNLNWLSIMWLYIIRSRLEQDRLVHLGQGGSIVRLPRHLLLHGRVILNVDQGCGRRPLLHLRKDRRSGGPIHRCIRQYHTLDCHFSFECAPFKKLSSAFSFYK